MQFNVLPYIYIHSVQAADGGQKSWPDHYRKACRFLMKMFTRHERLSHREHLTQESNSSHLQVEVLGWSIRVHELYLVATEFFEHLIHQASPWELCTLLRRSPIFYMLLILSGNNMFITKDIISTIISTSKIKLFSSSLQSLTQQRSSQTMLDQS